MRENSSRSKIITIVSIFIFLSAILFAQFGAVQTVQGQTCDPAVDPACPTAIPLPNCGVPGTPDCTPIPQPTNPPLPTNSPPTNPPPTNPPPTNPPPTDPPPTATLPRPTQTKAPTSTSTLTPLPTGLPTITFTPTEIPSATAGPSPTPKPWYSPVLSPSFHFLFPPPPSFLVALIPKSNIEAFNVEITQAIQCLSNPTCPDNAVRLFTGKPTMIRLYVRLTPNSWYDEVKGIGGELCPGVHNAQGCANPIHSLNYVTVKQTPADVSLFRGDINSTLNFILPSSWSYGNFTAYVNMRGENFYNETSFTDNFQSRPFQEYTSQRLDIMFVPVKSRGFLADINEAFTNRDWLTLTYPTSNIQLWWMSGIINNTPDTYNWNDTSGGCGDGWSDLLGDLHWYKGSNPQIFYGMVHKMSLKGTPYAGCGRYSGGVAGGEVNTGDRYGAAVAAQEIGHTLKRTHAPGCGAGSPDPYYPNSGATLDEYGLDVTRSQVYPPGMSFDFMGYCGDANSKWTSLYTYSAIASLLPQGVYVPGGQGTSVAQQPRPSGLGQIVPISFNTQPALNLAGNGPAAAADPVPSDSLYLVGSGSISPQKVTLKRGFFLLSADSIAPPTADSGPYTLELLNADGKVLSGVSFKPNEESNAVPGDIGTFNITIPWIEGASGYQFKYNGTVIANSMADLHTPSVENITSTGGSHWPNTGTVTISWNPAYKGSNPLQYLVQYSLDGGKTWSMLSVGLTQPTLDLDAALMAGSQQAQIRVYVSDGFNSSFAVSDLFKVDNKAPAVHIGWTTDGAQITAGQPVFLNGAATDAQDGPISGSALIWTIDNTPLGNGDTIVTSGIGVGEHVISLAATNAEGLSGKTSIHLTIVPAAPKPQATAELNNFARLILWAILPVGFLLVVLAAILLLRKSRKPRV